MNRRVFSKACSMAMVGVASPVLARRLIAAQLRRSRPTFDVRQFGALGNGTTDDKLSFWNALEAAGKVGGVLTVPPGQYRVTATMRIPSGVSLIGAGPQSVIHHDGGLIALWCVGTRDVEMRDLQIMGRFAHGVMIQEATRAVVHGVRISGSTIPRFNYAAAVYIIESAQVTVEKCHLSGNGLDGPMVSSDIQCDGTTQASNDIHIIQNECLSTNVTSNIRCYDMARGEVRGNRVQGARLMRSVNGGYGIVLYETTTRPGSCVDNIVMDNHVSDTEGAGIYLNRAMRSRVTGNRIERVGAKEDDTSLPVAGVALNQCNGSEVANNRITDSGSAGISVSSNVEDIDHIVVENNVVMGARGIGIHLRGILTDVRVVGNVVDSAAGGIGSVSEHPQDLIEIIGNTISNSPANRGAITLTNAHRTNVRDNVLHGNAGLALDLTFRDSASKAQNNRSGKDGPLLPAVGQRIRVLTP